MFTWIFSCFLRICNSIKFDFFRVTAGMVAMSFSSHSSRIFLFTGHLRNLFFYLSFIEHYRIRYFVLCSGVRWYVYMNLFMIFMHLQHCQIPVFLGSWGGRYFIYLPPGGILFFISPCTENYRLWYFIWCWRVTRYVTAVGTRDTTPYRLLRYKDGSATTRSTIQKIPDDYDVLTKT
jgi:hypothetical protein